LGSGGDINELDGKSCGEVADCSGDVGAVIGDGIGGRGDDSDETDVVDIDPGGENGNVAGGEIGGSGNDVGGSSGEVEVGGLDDGTDREVGT